MDIIKSLFSPIEKLITEHGSASILRDHINLLKEKFSLLEKENFSLKEEKDVLDKKNKELESQFENTTKEIESLKKLNQEFQREASQKEEKLDEVNVQILQQFFDTKNDLSPKYFESSLSLETNIVKYHFDILLNLKYIDYASTGSDPSCLTRYSITPAGRKCVMETIRN